jgi:hypothetical protein
MARRAWSDYRHNLTLQVMDVGGASMALQFGSPVVVLPWIGHHLGVAYVVSRCWRRWSRPAT